MEKFNIICDSREQNPLNFKAGGCVEHIISAKLNAGDYSIEGFENRIAIERKNPIDLFQTLGKGHKRFRKELERAKDYDYFGILVECSFKEVLNKTFENSHFSSMRGDVVIQICMTLKLKYGIDVVFANDRIEASSYVRNLFKSYVKIKVGELNERKKICGVQKKEAGRIDGNGT